MYDDILADLEGVFATTEWTSQSIAMYPDNYQGKKAKTNGKVEEYCILKVMPTASRNYAYGAEKEMTGIIGIKMFVPAGDGQGRIMQISDTLDTLLDNRRLTNGTQLGTSYINIEGLDASNKSLYGASYLIPFTIYGE